MTACETTRYYPWVVSTELDQYLGRTRNGLVGPTEGIRRGQNTFVKAKGLKRNFRVDERILKVSKSYPVEYVEDNRPKRHSLPLLGQSSEEA